MSFKVKPLRRLHGIAQHLPIRHLRTTKMRPTSEKDQPRKTALQRRLEKLHDNIVQRCTNPNHPAYKRYGGREDGPPIRFHEPWRRNRKLFIEELLAEIGSPRHRSDSLDRINRNGNYEPGNIKWSTKSEQAANRQSTRIVEVNGVSVLSPDAARALGKTPDALRKLIQRCQPDDAQVKQVEAVWNKKVIQQEYRKHVVSFSPDQVSAIKRAIKRLSTDIELTNVLAAAVHFWPEFTLTIREEAGLGTSPSAPDLKFCLKHIELAVGFWEQKEATRNHVLKRYPSSAIRELEGQ